MSDRTEWVDREALDSFRNKREDTYGVEVHPMVYLRMIDYTAWLIRGIIDIWQSIEQRFVSNFNTDPVKFRASTTCYTRGYWATG